MFNGQNAIYVHVYSVHNQFFPGVPTVATNWVGVVCKSKLNPKILTEPRVHFSKLEHFRVVAN